MQKKHWESILEGKSNEVVLTEGKLFDFLEYLYDYFSGEDYNLKKRAEEFKKMGQNEFKQEFLGIARQYNIREYDLNNEKPQVQESILGEGSLSDLFTSTWEWIRNQASNLWDWMASADTPYIILAMLGFALSTSAIALSPWMFPAIRTILVTLWCVFGFRVGAGILLKKEDEKNR